ncbi:MAG: hypothetical protein Q9190_007110 [Brigantiaea leucoxantha]
MSQMKIWKIVKKRRDERTAERLRQEQSRDQDEEDLGRKLEEGNQQDRNAWEAAYGGRNTDRQHVDSGIGTEAPSVGKGSLSIVNTSSIIGSQADSIEMSNLERSQEKSESGSISKGKGRATVTIRVASDDELPPSGRISDTEQHTVLGTLSSPPSAENLITHSPSPAIKDFSQTSAAGEETSDEAQKNSETSRSSRKVTGPEIVPLPFRVPQAGEEDQRSSLGASIASENAPGRTLKRLSGPSLMRNLSKRSQRSYVATSTSEEALMIPFDDDDQASSIAATMDEVSDGHGSEADTSTLADILSPVANGTALPKISPPTEPHPMDRPGHKISDLSLGHRLSSAPVGEDVGQKQETDGASASLFPRSRQGSVSADQVEAAKDRDTQQVAEEPAKDPLIEGKIEAAQGNNPGTTVAFEERKATRKSLADQLPEAASRVVMAFRTNEWAKHLDQAEKPSLDDLRSAQQQQNAAFLEGQEKAAPLNVVELQQTPLTAEPAPAKFDLPKVNTTVRKPPSRSNRSPISPQRSQSDLLRRKSFENQMVRSSSQTSLDSLSSQRNVSKLSLRRGSSQTSLTPNRGYRSSSNPLASPLAESPIEEDVPSTFPQRYVSSPLPPDTLMSQRQSMMQTRPSSTSLNRNVSNKSSTTSLGSMDADNISLAARRSLIHQQQQQHHHHHHPNQPQQHRSSTHSIPAFPHEALNSYPYPLPPHHQQNSSSNPNTTISAWRASLQPSVTAVYREHDLDRKRGILLEEKRQNEGKEREEMVRKGIREREVDGRMRRGEMEGRHREAMRRLQGGVR